MTKRVYNVGHTKDTLHVTRFTDSAVHIDGLHVVVVVVVVVLASRSGDGRSSQQKEVALRITCDERLRGNHAVIPRWILLRT